MDRIGNMFASLREKGETAFIPFSVAGYPNEEQSLELFLELCRSGCDLLEFGFPFSDPVADGPVIQRAATTAIRNGMTMEKAFHMVARIREESDTPIIFFTYFNPIHRYGTKRFVEKAKECGLDGVLVVDVPLEEADWLKPLTDEAGLSWIYLATPTTPSERIKAMDANGSGFLYYVSVTGVTGARNDLPADLAETCALLRGTCRLPLAVGFGVSSPEQAAWLKPHVDAVVVGSALISRIATGETPAQIGRWTSRIKAALT